MPWFPPKRKPQVHYSSFPTQRVQWPQDDVTAPLTITIHNTMNAQIVFSQLEDYLEELEQDKRTHYNNNPRYCEEDESFLTDAIDRTRLMIHHLALQHSTLVRKM